MEVILFVHKGSGENGDRFRTEMDILNREVSFTLIQDFNTLRRRLAKPVGFGRPELFVLLADTAQRLDRFTEFINDFEDRRLLMVLPDENPETLSKIHKFCPRFFAYLNDTYEDLCAVIVKIKEQGEKNDTYTR